MLLRRPPPPPSSTSTSDAERDGGAGLDVTEPEREFEPDESRRFRIDGTRAGARVFVGEYGPTEPAVGDVGALVLAVAAVGDDGEAPVATVTSAVLIAPGWHGIATAVRKAADAVLLRDRSSSSSSLLSESESLSVDEADDMTDEAAVDGVVPVTLDE